MTDSARTPSTFSVRRRSLVALAAVALLVPDWRGQAQVPRPLVVAREARAVAPGEMVLLTLSGPGPLAAVDVTAFGHQARTFAGATADACYALIGIDLDTSAGRYDVVISANADGRPLSAVHRLVVSAKAFGVRRLKVDPRFVTPPAAALPRIEREQRRLADILAGVSPERLWRGRFVVPVDGAPALNFGQRSVFNGQPRGSHRGSDFASPSGAPVRAPGAGRVVLAEELYYSGNTVLIDHGLGLFSLLGHLSRIDVPVGRVVDQGAQVGAVGATGRATGPHLHWTLRLGSAAVDPLSLVALKGMPG